jgi:hypothetical protein
MDGTEYHHAKWDKTSSESQILHVFAHMQILDLKKVIIWHYCKRGTFLGKDQKEGMGRVLVIMIKVYYICVLK